MMTLEDRWASATRRHERAAVRQARTIERLRAASWLLLSSRALLYRPRPRLAGGSDDGIPAAAIRARLQDLVASGVLPRKPPTKMFAGPSPGRTCVACGSPIVNGEIEFEAGVVDNITLFLHRRCAAIWTGSDGEGAAPRSGAG
jgi:hypothetical protein